MSDSSIPNDLVDPACSSWWPMGPTSAELSDWREKDVAVPVVVAPPVILSSPAADSTQTDADKLRQSEFEAQAEMYRTMKSSLCDCSNCINARERNLNRQEGITDIRQSEFEAQAEMYRTRKSLLCDCSNCINARESARQRPLDIPKQSARCLERQRQAALAPNSRAPAPVRPPLQGSQPPAGRSDISQGGITYIRSLFRFLLPSDEAIDIASIFSSN